MGEERVTLKEEYASPESVTKPYIAVKHTGEAVTFLWTSSSKSQLKSSVDLKLRVEWEELLWFAKKLNCNVDKKEILFSDLDPYNRVLIYACVRKTIQSLHKARRLAYLLLDLNSWEAFYWASAIREKWWENRSIKKLYRTAKAFKILFDLE